MDIWFTSDTHFGHENFLTFTDNEGNLVRKFDSIEEHDNLLIENWNKNVKKNDRVYHLGDVALNKTKFNSMFPKLNGSKRLILGNHDEIKDYKLYEYFKKITVWRVFREYDFTLSHIPMHMDYCKTTFNVHGHIHSNVSPDIRHINICVEHTNYTPVHLDELLTTINARRELL